MAVRKPTFAFDSVEFANALLAEREVGPRAQLTVDQLLQRLPSTAKVVYVIDKGKQPCWIPKATAGETGIAQQFAYTAAGLALLCLRSPARGRTRSSS